MTSNDLILAVLGLLTGGYVKALWDTYFSKSAARRRAVERASSIQELVSALIPALHNMIMSLATQGKPARAKRSGKKAGKKAGRKGKRLNKKPGRKPGGNAFSARKGKPGRKPKDKTAQPEAAPTAPASAPNPLNIDTPAAQPRARGKGTGAAQPAA